MNITYIIGNGFDINLGLKTSYRDFYEYILAQENNTDSNMLYNSIKKDFKAFPNKDEWYELATWSDFEIALGKKTFEADLDVEKFENDFYELHQEFKNYLETRIKNYIPIESEIYHVFTSFLEGLESNEKRKIIRKLEKENEKKFLSLNYNFLSFNYTDTLQKQLDLVGDTSSSTEWFFMLSDYIIENSKIDEDRTLSQHRLLEYSNVIHLHADLKQGMFLGLDNEKQLNHNIFDRNFRDKLIKPKMNELYNDAYRDDALDVVNKTDVFIFFGCSLGETDAFWMEKVVKTLFVNKEAYCIIHSYSKNVNKEQIYYKEKDRIRNIKQNLLKYISDSYAMESDDSNILNRIFIVEKTEKLFQKEDSEVIKDALF